ncbi:MAG: radical SAM family heme chaperone HemW [Clostridia bacterium]|nr:radical SAM family heme chaperone HemW [Clostridia bacterium]
MDRTKAGLYFHIPFCQSKCPYCDFYSLTDKGLTEAYVNALCEEMKTFDRIGEFVKKDKKIPVDTVYFGGGTPSLLSPLQLERILASVRENFSLSEDAEITAECNPSSPFLGEFLQSAAENGVNRISLGMQSSSDNERKKLGRRGTASDVENAVKLVRASGIENISLDVMVGVPDSNTGTLKDSLDFVSFLGVPHISAYMLKIEEGTFYCKNIDKLNIPDEDETADMYLFMSDYLREKGYLHYEISNFGKEGFISRHNMKYWELAPYIGFGPSAHSFYGGKRFYFPRDINAFINGEKALFDGEGGDEEEKLMLSLRTYKGVSLEEKNKEFIKLTEKFVSQGLGEIRGGSFVLTPGGMLVSNSIILMLTEVI